MATLTGFVGSERLAQVTPPAGGVLLPLETTTTFRKYGIGDYSETYYGRGLATTEGNLPAGIPGVWTAGTITSFEIRYRNELLVRLDQFSIAAVELNQILTQGLSIFDIIMTGSDLVSGSQFSDLLGASGGNDSLLGGSGNDSFIEGYGNDFYDGGSGVDTLIVTGFSKSETQLTRGPADVWTLFETSIRETNTLRNIEYVKYSDITVSLLDLALGSPTPPDVKGTQVYRFAKVDSGQYFYTGDIGERNLIVSTLNNFRYEGSVFNAQDNWVTNYNPVYRFANLLNGGYFYTSSAAERDIVFSDYAATYRYEGASFFVPASATADTIPVYRLANVKTGGYLFTANASERQFAQSLGFFRDEGVAFNAPRTISLAFDSSDETQLSNDFSVEISNTGNAVISQLDWFV